MPYDPDDDYAMRKARRQYGQNGHIVFAVVTVITILIVTWLGKQFPGR